MERDNERQFGIQDDKTDQQGEQGNIDEILESLEDRLHDKAKINFLRKVFGILSAQLGSTALLVALVRNSPALRNFIQNSPGIGIFAKIGSMVCIFGLALSRRLARTVPYNYYILGSGTLCVAWSVSYICSKVPSNVLLATSAGTASAVIGILFYALRANKKFSYKKAFITSSITILISQLMSAVILKTSKLSNIASLMCAITSCIFLLIKTQQVTGQGNTRYSHDDYIQASNSLYLDIIEIFVKLLRMLAKLKKKEEEKEEEKDGKKK